MSKSVSELFAEKNEMILKGEIVAAATRFFADNAKTYDFDGTVTSNKTEELAKMNGFVGAIAAVNGITLHSAAVGGNVSFAEYTFNFDMKDGSKILWHEIIRSEWHNGHIVDERYFKA